MHSFKPFSFLLIICLNFNFIATAQKVELNFDFDNALSFSPKLNGFNTGPTFNEIFTSSPTNINIVDNCALLAAPFNTFSDRKIVSFQPKSDFVDKTAKLKPSTLRFPGGTISNYYHLYEYNNGGYDPNNAVFANGKGILDEETKAYPTSNPIRKQYCNWDNRVMLDDENENPNFINGFANLILALEEKVKVLDDPSYKIDVIYVANILTHFEFKFLFNKFKDAHLLPSDPLNVLNIADPNSPFELYYKETIDAITYLVDRGVNVVGVEMSNELYFNVYQNANNNVTAEDYMKISEIYSARIKDKYPHLKVGVVSEAANSPWKNKISSYSPAFYDAVIVHNYYSSTLCINANETCGTTCYEDVINDISCRFDCGKCALGNYINNDLRTELQESIYGYPLDKKIWLTEWGIISPNGQGNNLDYFNTFLYAAYTFEHVLQQFSFNAESGDRIQYATHHRIGYKINWSVVQQELRNENAEIRSNYYSFSFLKDLFYSDKIYAYEGIAPLGFDNFYDFYSKSFFTVDSLDNISVFICFSNKSASEIGVSNIGIESLHFNGIEYIANQKVSANFLNGSADSGLYSSFGKTQFNGVSTDLTNNPTLFINENIEFDHNNITLPAFSMGFLKYELKANNVSVKEVPSFESSFSMYPNPAGSEIYFNFIGTHNQIKLEVFDIYGSQTWTQLSNFQNILKIDISNFETGTYFVKLTSENGIETQKFIKI